MVNHQNTSAISVLLALQLLWVQNLYFSGSRTLVFFLAQAAHNPPIFTLVCCFIGLRCHVAAQHLQQPLFTLRFLGFLEVLAQCEEDVLEGVDLPDVVVVLLDQQLLVVGFGVEVLDDRQGVCRWDHPITLGVDEESGNSAILNDRGQVDGEGVVRVGKEMLLQNRNAKIYDHLGHIHRLLGVEASDGFEGAKWGVQHLEDDPLVGDQRGIEETGHRSHRAAPQYELLEAILLQLIED